MLIYLAFWVSWDYNVAKANKGRTRGVTSTPRPYAGVLTTYTTVITAPILIIAAFYAIFKGCVGFVSVCGVGLLIDLCRFCLSRRTREQTRGGRVVSHPHGPDRRETADTIIYKERIS